MLSGKETGKVIQAHFSVDGKWYLNFVELKPGSFVPVKLALKPLKVGDRVRVYGTQSGNYIGIGAIKNIYEGCANVQIGLGEFKYCLYQLEPLAEEPKIEKETQYWVYDNSQNDDYRDVMYWNTEKKWVKACAKKYGDDWYHNVGWSKIISRYILPVKQSTLKVGDKVKIFPLEPLNNNVLGEVAHIFSGDKITIVNKWGNRIDVDSHQIEII